MRAREKGIKAQAITDHGPFLGRNISSTFYERLNNPIDGIILFKGMECNVINEDGDIDVVEKFIQWYDIVLLGFHDYEKKDESPQYYAEVMIKAIKKNPCVDIIVHPNAPHYLIDFRMLADTAAETNTAVELNNAKTRLGRSSEEQTIELIEACIASGCDVAVNTDAHALNEVGDHSVMENLLRQTNFPQERIVNRSMDSTLKWIEQRREHRRLSY